MIQQHINPTSASFESLIKEAVLMALSEYGPQLARLIHDDTACVSCKAKNKEDSILTRQQVIDLLKISPPTLHNWVNQKLLTPRRIGRRVYYSKEEIERLLTARKRYH